MKPTLQLIIRILQILRFLFLLREQSDDLHRSGTMRFGRLASVDRASELYSPKLGGRKGVQRHRRILDPVPEQVKIVARMCDDTTSEK